jgi:hypothetical protein
MPPPSHTVKSFKRPPDVKSLNAQSGEVRPAGSNIIEQYERGGANRVTAAAWRHNQRSQVVLNRRTLLFVLEEIDQALIIF